MTQSPSSPASPSTAARMRIMPRMQIMLSGALVALAGLSFGPVFGQLGGFGPEPAGLPGPPALLVAVLVPVTVVVVWGLVVGRIAQRPGGAQTAVGVVAMLVAVAVVTRPGVQVMSGPRRLLTSALPVDAAGPELAAVSTLTGFAALVAVQLALTSRWVLAPLLPALVCLLAGLALGAGIGPLPAWYPVALLVLVSALLTHARCGGQSRRVGTGLLLSAAVITLVAAVAVPLLGPVLPAADREPADVRALIGAPVQPRERINPFARYVALREGMVPLEITGTASAPFERLHMVTLTEFDGHSWFVHADYRRAGHRLPPPAESVAGRVGSAPMRVIEMDVTVRPAEMLGWLPTPGRAQQISVAGLGVDEQTGDVVIPEGRTAPTQYRVVGVEPTPTPQALRADEPAPAATPLALDVPPEVLDFVGAATTGVPSGFPRFSALYSRLTDPSFSVDESPGAPGGHGFYAISALLRDKRGTSEQYASAFALMCRSLGWDARVVLGFRPRFDGPGLTARGEDVHAWVEVRFARLGWVSVDPTPTRTAGEKPGEQVPTPTGRADDPVTAAIDAEQQAPPEPDAAAGPFSPPAAEVSRFSPGEVVLLGVLASVLLAGPAVSAIPIGKAARRARRRRREAARARTLGAWWEVVDRLVESGVPIRRSSTTAEVLAAMPGAPPQLITLGALADRAAYAPDELSPAAADVAWQDSDHLRRTIRHRLPFSRRLRATFDPRPLLLRR